MSSEESGHSELSPVANSLGSLFERFIGVWQTEQGRLPTLPYEPEWKSLCQDGEPDADGNITWQPRLRYPIGDFSGVESALELTLHPDIKAFYGSYWSETIRADSPNGGLDLIQVWNRQDFDRLLENIIGHVIAKRRARHAITVFVAPTDEEEYFLSIDNQTGEVYLESPGLAPVRTLATSVCELLDSLAPVTDRPDI